MVQQKRMYIGRGLQFCKGSPSLVPRLLVGGTWVYEARGLHTLTAKIKCVVLAKYYTCVTILTMPNAVGADILE